MNFVLLSVYAILYLTKKHHTSFENQFKIQFTVLLVIKPTN